MRVLVTGASGLLGRGVCSALVERGDEVAALVRSTAAPPPGTTPLRHDLCEPFPANGLPPVDCVVHLAHHPHVGFPDHASALHRLNTSATQELLDAGRAAGIDRFVYASSGAVYGSADHVLDEDEAPAARDFYALTKLHAEAYLAAYASYFETVIVRPFFPYGRGQVGRLIPRLADRIRRGEPIELHADERPRLNPVFVDDAVDAIVAAADGRAPAILNLAGPDVVSVRELAEAVASLLGHEPMFRHRSDAIGGDYVARPDRLRSVLQRPLTRLDAGLADTLVGATPEAQAHGAAGA